MRKLLGGAIFVIGVGALGFYANANHAKRMQTRIADNATDIVTGTMHGVTTQVAGRDIRVSGIAHDIAERDTILAALNTINGRRIVTDALEILPIASPYQVLSEKTSDGQTYSGFVPTEAVRGMFAEGFGGDNAAGFSLASGMPDAGWPDVALKGSTALGLLEYGVLTLRDRDLTITGMAATPVEQAAALALVADLPDGYVAITDIGALIPLSSPYTMYSTKNTDGQTYNGMAPDTDIFEVISDFMGTRDGLSLDWGMPDDMWPDVVGKSLAAMAQLESAEMSLVDRDLILTGVARTPVERAVAEAFLADLPEGYTKAIAIETLDDGAPVAYTITYSEGRPPMVTGKLPIGVTPQTLARALGVPFVEGSPILAGIGDPAAATALHEKLAGLARWMPDMQAFTYADSDAGIELASTLRPGMDGAGLRTEWAGLLGEGAVLSVESEALANTGPLPQEGDRRFNSVLRKQEVYLHNVWVLVVDFAATPENCAATASAVLEKAKINFLTGSAELDPSSFRAINNLSALIQGCLDGNTDMIEVGGHTDSDGSDDLNQQLSQARAQAVVDALVERDVPQGRINARGYGESEPIADNATAEGKALNRRTTIRWIAQ